MRRIESQHMGLVEQHQPQGNSTDCFGIYVCPICKNALEQKAKKLMCHTCDLSYHIINGIPDFILEDISKSSNQIFRRIKAVDHLAKIYESILWYPIVLNIYGGIGTPPLKELVRIVAEIVNMDKGLILDVACGPGTYGRHIASESNTVYGIDISMGMLHQGVSYVKKGNIPNVHFARAKVQQLPFREAIFDAAICCGALHLFTDTVVALQEIGRTMKEGASLAVMTFIAGNRGILRFSRIREHINQNHGFHVFEIPELKQYLFKAGFENFQPQLYGSALLFSAQKQRV
jgi:ubiquinone/menaquinone biosynthesis C-methylase UbiE/uncharacterized protein YbaR (Trm112 family)